MDNPDICLNDPYQDISDEFGWTRSEASAGKEPEDAGSHDMDVEQGTCIEEEEEVDWGGDEEHHDAQQADETEAEEDEEEEEEHQQEEQRGQDTASEACPETKLEAASDLPEAGAAQAGDTISLEEDDDECLIVSVELPPPQDTKGKGKAKGKAPYSSALKGKGGKGRGKGPIAKQYPSSRPQIAKAMMPTPKPKPQAHPKFPQPKPPQLPPPPAQPARQSGSAPPVKAAPVPPQVSVDMLLLEQVRLQLLTEPGKRASMRRLLAQPKVSQLLRHMSSCRRLAFSSMPSVLCELLRKSADAFHLTESGSEAAAAIQDVRVSLTEHGEGAPLVEKKIFDNVFASLFSARPAAAAPSTTVGKAPGTALGTTTGMVQRAASSPQSEVAARNLSKQRALQQIRDLDNGASGIPSRDAPPDGPRPPSMPPPNYKADWKRFQPTTKRVLAPRRTGSGNLDDAAPGTPTHTESVRSLPSPPAPPPAVPPVSTPPGILATSPSHSGPRPPHPAVPSHPTPPPGPPGHHGPHPPFGAPPQRNTVPEPVDNEGRPFDLERVVVNFANVGATYGSRVLKKDKQRNSYLFDYEGVRRCVRHLTQKRKLRVIGVIFENFHGDENGREVFQVPPDISAMCESIELTPRLLGQRHKSADDEMTIKCAYRRNCRFLDNDNYQDWRNYLADEAVRTWLLHCQEFLQMKFYFDSGLGDFDILEGNIPAAWLAQGPAKRMCTRPWK